MKYIGNYVELQKHKMRVQELLAKLPPPRKKSDARYRKFLAVLPFVCELRRDGVNKPEMAIILQLCGYRISVDRLSWFMERARISGELELAERAIADEVLVENRPIEREWVLEKIAGIAKHWLSRIRSALVRN